MQYPDIRKILLTPNPGMWDGLEKHAKEALLTKDLSDKDRKICEEIAKTAKKLADMAAAPLN